MPDSTDAALGQFLRKLIHDGGELHVRYPTEDGYSEQRIHIEDRVVAGRPDQPTQTTPLFEGTVASVVPTVVGDFHIDIATTDDSNLPALGDRVTVYATDPHTPDEGDTP